MSYPSVSNFCPVSVHELRKQSRHHLFGERLFYHLECPFCGSFLIQHGVDFFLNSRLEIPNDRQSLSRKQVVVAYAIRRMGASGNTPQVTYDLVDQILKEDRLPSLLQQQDNLLLWLAKETDASSRHTLRYDEIGAIVGCPSRGVFMRLLEEMTKRSLLSGEEDIVGLSYGGLERLEELRRTTPTGFEAVIAMKFNDPTLDELVDDYLRSAVLQTGFQLFRVNDRPEAGLIDAKIRNDIRQARFVIADETHGNLGAYWEAGYAEGLGKPVIYICEKSVFEGKSKSAQAPHFDTNHHTTVLWQKGAFPEAAEKLKQTIRFTIPEARQRDE